MERKKLNLLLSHDNRKSAKRYLVKVTSSDGEAHFSRIRSRPPRPSVSEVTVYGSISSSTPTMNCKSETHCSVVPSGVNYRKQRMIRLPSQDDLWKSIKSNYLFIMDNNLIKECQKTRKELSLCSTRSSPTSIVTQQTISFPEYVERFNALHDRLHILLTSVEDSTEGYDFSNLHLEMDLLEGEYIFLKDQSSILQRLDPGLKDDVSRRYTILKNKWEVLESAMKPKKNLQQDVRTKSLKAEIRTVRKWLRGVEERLRRLKVTKHSSPEDIKNAYKEEKVLQREIEDRGKVIHSLIRRCQSATDGATGGLQRLSRFALHLERSWHHIWIRSLEIQCLTEQHLQKQASVTSQNWKETSDQDSDEGPLRKHRRLTQNYWTAATATMDRLRNEQTTKRQGDARKGGSGLQTRDVGVLCSEKVPVNDKCIMVGTTGIAALKAEYGDDFTNFEIIQDVGYSSESSTHLSGDDAGLDHPFNVRIYKFTEDNQPTSPMSLKDELESATCFRNFHSLGSSLESSSSAAASLDDSGLGTGEGLTGIESGDALRQFRVEEDYEQEDLDYLETVLDEYVDFGANTVSDQEELHFNLSGLDSDDPSDNFHNRSSFTTSAQVFYKMISVDSDNCDADNNNHPTENNKSNNNNTTTSSTVSSIDNCQSHATTDTPFLKNTNFPLETNFQDHTNDNSKCCSLSDSDPETYKPVPLTNTSNWKESRQSSHRIYCSTPRKEEDVPSRSSCRHPGGLKRKRGYDSPDAARMSNHVRSWLNRCSDFSSPLRVLRPTTRTSPEPAATQEQTENVSSCDASCECTSSSADEGNNNALSTRSSLCDEDVFRLKSRVDSSVQGSIETVVHALLDPDYPFLLPPPPSSTASFGSGSKNCSSTTVSGRVKKRGRRLKASSDGDLEKPKNKEILHSPIRSMFQKHKTASCSTVNRLHSSLPTVLRGTSDSSTDDNWTPSALPFHSDTKTVGCHHSSSSDFGRRRRRRSRKKSSSSNRSSTSALFSGGDSGRHRSRTGTSSTSRCGSRRRHRSQRSEFFCPDVGSSDEDKSSLKVEIPPVEENVGFDELCRASSALMSPAESDIVLTHLEEQSTVSDQVWDGYQEMPYLSEGYSEATVDEDAVRKLTEFGDDYGSAIGHPIRLLEPNVEKNKLDNSKCPKKCPKSIPITARLSGLSDDTDSDSEDLCYVIEEAAKALNFAQLILKRREEGDNLTPADYAELLATCGTHLRCLQTICKHINGQEHNFSSDHLKQLNYLIEQWQELQRNAEMFEKSEDPARQKYLKAQENIDSLYNKMSQIASCSHLNVAGLVSWEDLEKDMSRLQMVLSSLQETKEQLLSVNLQVHRFTTEYGSDDNYKDCCLKDDITELYRQWEDIYEQNGSHLTELEALKTDWEVYSEKFHNLRLRVKDAELTNDNSCDNSAVTSTDCNNESLQKDLVELERCADLLEYRLNGGEAWKTIEEELRCLRCRIHHGNDASVHRAAIPSVNHRNPSSRVEEDADDHFEDAIQQICEDTDRSSQHKKDVATSMTPKRSRGRFWRIVRVAVPVQFALVLLYCLACYLEPSCCNALNNFNFSFTPQLRYLGGKPPV